MMNAAEQAMLVRQEWLLLRDLYQRDRGKEPWQTQEDNDGALVAYLGVWCRPKDFDKSAYRSYRHPLQLAEEGMLQCWSGPDQHPVPARRRHWDGAFVFRDKWGGFCDIASKPIGDVYDPAAGWTVKPTLSGAQGRGQTAAYMVWVPSGAVVCVSRHHAFRASSLVVGPCIWTAGKLPSGLLPCCAWEAS